VTPCLNEGQFIEETIRSVLLQGYPDFEYIIIDGDSSDRSVEIIKKYEKWLTFWLSELDHGQAHAINKGFKRITGDIVAWINSDDFYMAEAFSYVCSVFTFHQDIDMIYGDMLLKYEDKTLNKIYKPCKFSLTDQIRFRIIPQPTCFWRSSLFNKMGYLDESYHYMFDVEYWIRAGYHIRIKYFPVVLAGFLIHKQSKTQKNTILSAQEGIRMYENIFFDSHISKSILRHRRVVLEYWYERLALKYFEEGFYLKARYFFRKAILLTPWRPQNVTLMIYIIDTFLHSNIGRCIQRLSIKTRIQIRNTKKFI